MPPGWLTAISRHFRRKRMERFLREFGVAPQTTILDVGGIADYWAELPHAPRVTLLNMPRTKNEIGAAQSWVAGDGRMLPFRDGAFDIVFSNSVIEHVGDAASQRQFAQEVARVGRAYWVQTPNRWFPVESHLLTPFIHWLPLSWQRAIVPRFTVWSVFTRVAPDRREFFLRHYLSDIRLLDSRELGSLFPGARIVRERAGGLTKSLIAARK